MTASVAIAVRAGPVLDDKGLAEPCVEPLAHQARGDVDAAAGSETGDNPRRPVRVIAQRRSRPRQGGKAGRGGDGLQELAPFHDRAPQ